MPHKTSLTGRLGSVSLLLTRIILRKKASLLQGHVRLLVRPRALPLDLDEPRPLEASLRRNIRAALSGPPLSTWPRLRASPVLVNSNS